MIERRYNTSKTFNGRKNAQCCIRMFKGCSRSAQLCSARIGSKLLVQ